MLHILFDKVSEGVLVVEMSLTVFVLESVTILVLESIRSFLLTYDIANCWSIL